MNRVSLPGGVVRVLNQSYLRHFTLSALGLPGIETLGYKIGRADGTGKRIM